MLTRHVQRAGIVAGVVVSALLFFLGGAALRLLMGPISLGPFAGAIEDSLNRSISGLVVRFDQAVLEWSRAESKVNLIILGTKVFDRNGHIVAQAPKADLDFDAAALIGGHLSLKRFALIGVQLTAVRSADGQLKLGFGPDQDASDLLDTMRMILQDSGKGAGSLQSFSVVDARLAFQDEGSGIFVVSPDASLTLRNDNGHLDATLDSSLEISGAPVRLSLRAALRDDGMPESGTVDIRGLSFASLAQNSTMFAQLAPYRLTSDIASSFTLGENRELLTATFHVTGKGTVDTKRLKAPLRFDRYVIDASFDGAGNALTFDRIDIEGPEISGAARAALRLAWNEGVLSSVTGNTEVRSVQLNLPELFRDKLDFARLSLEGRFDRAAKTLSWNRADIESEPLRASFSGAVTFDENQSPAIRLSGLLTPRSLRDVLRYWPIGKSDGAHDWIDENIAEGSVGPARVEMNIPKGAFAAEALPETALSVTFPFEGVRASYIHGMTPIVGAKGEATLTGDTFRVTMTSGAVGPIAATNGSFVATELHVHGSPGRIRVHAEGRVPDVLALIDEQPLGYAKRFNIDPKTSEGRAAVDLDISLPMLRSLPMDQLRIGVQAKVAGLAVPIDGKHRLEDGNVSFVIDKQSLASEGTAAIAGVPVNFRWNEEFSDSETTTHIDLAGMLDDAKRAGLGLSEPQWLKGPIPLNVALRGKRFRFTGGDVQADLTRASAEFSLLNIEKSAGEPARARLSLRFDEGGVSVTDLAVTGDGLDVRGSLGLDRTGKLVDVSLNPLRAGVDNDLALELAALPDGGHAIRLRGRSLDATRLFGKEKAAEAPDAAAGVEKNTTFADPLNLDVAMDRIVFRDDLAFGNVSLSFALGNNERLNDFRLEADGPLRGKINGRLTTEKGARDLRIQADDAEGVVRTFLGFSSIRGGDLTAQISFPADDPRFNGPPADYIGNLTLNNLVITDQPFLARLFAAGSLDGPLRLLQGEGIAISRFNAPFSVKGKIVTIHEGRASGPAIGMTFAGMIDRRSERVDLTGTLVPAYGINSILGNVPVIGDIFVSKKGEGIFGLTYAMKGNLGEPTISVNPLSVLTPGFLRRIFEFSPARVPEADSQAQGPAAPENPVPPPGADPQAVPARPE